jgi:hypothetical protein
MSRGPKRERFLGWIEGYLWDGQAFVRLVDAEGFEYDAEIPIVNFPQDDQEWLGRHFEVLPRCVGRPKPLIQWVKTDARRVLCGCCLHRDGLLDERPVTA